LEETTEENQKGGPKEEGQRNAVTPGDKPRPVLKGEGERIFPEPPRMAPKLRGPNPGVPFQDPTQVKILGAQWGPIKVQRAKS